MRTRYEVAALMAWTAIVAVGCGGPDAYESGVLEVDWELAPRGCESAGVDEIEVALPGEPRSRSARFDCGADRGRIEEVAAGMHSVEITGYGVDGTPTHGAVLEGVVVRPGEQTELSGVDVVGRTAGAEIEWSLAGEQTCASANVETVELTVYADGLHEVHRSHHPCSASPVEVDGLLSGMHLFRVRSADGHGRREGTVETELGPGEYAGLEIAMEAGSASSSNETGP